MNASVGLLPLPRPLMTAEVLDAGFRLFRSGVLHCLPYSGLAVLVIELPTLYSTFLAPRAGVSLLSGNLKLVSYLTVFLLSVPLLGLITLRLNALAEGVRPRFRPELAAALSGWPLGIFATAFAFGYPLALWILYPLLVASMPGTALVFAAIPVLWPVSIFLVALPAFWCDGLTPISALVAAVRVSIRRSWRMFGVVLATVCMVTVFFVLSDDHRLDDVAAVRARRSVPDRDRRIDALSRGRRVRRAVRARGAHRRVSRSGPARAGETRSAHVTRWLALVGPVVRGRGVRRR